MARFLAIAATLATGAALCAGLYWLFLNTPESNTLTLAASALLLMTIVVVAAISINAAVLLARGSAARACWGGAVGGVFWFVLALIPLAFAWWLIGHVDTWIVAHSGEINAWFIAQFGWADISRLFEAHTWISRWLRWAVFPLLSLSLLATLLTNEGGTTGAAFVTRAWHWRTLVVATAVFVVLFALPWQLTQWRPELPPTWVQPAAAAARLAMVTLFAVTGAATLVIVSVRDRVTK